MGLSSEDVSFLRDYLADLAEQVEDAQEILTTTQSDIVAGIAQEILDEAAEDIAEVQAVLSDFGADTSPQLDTDETTEKSAKAEWKGRIFR